MRYVLRWALILFPITGFAYFQQPSTGFGSIKGQVTTSDQKPAAAVSVQLKGTRKSTLTDEKGQFILQHIPVGTYQLEVSLIGYETLLQEVVIEQEQITAVALQLSYSQTQLQEVIVTGGRNKFSDKKTDQVARLPLKNLENPQVYQVVGKELMTEQTVTERSEVYRNVPGGVPNMAAGGSQGLSMRGFANTNGMRNGMAMGAVVPLNPAILERIEFIKGPSGTLFGNNRGVTFGGAYNYITKKPFERFTGEVTYTGGSYRFHRITTDINTPVNDQKTLLFRLNLAAQTEGSFQDQGFAKNYTIAPVVAYQVNERLKFLVDVDITRSNYTTSTLAIGDFSKVSARSFKDLPYSYKRTFLDNSVDVSNGINNLQLQAEYKISDQWTSQTNYLYSDGFYKHLYWTTLTLTSDTTIARSVRNQQPETWGNMQLQQNFIGDFAIGSLRNRVVLGLDYNYNYYDANRATVTPEGVNLRNPVITNFNKQKIDALSAEKFVATTYKAYTYSAYVSDVLNITPTLMTMLSLRVDRFITDGVHTVSNGKYTGDYQQTSLSPKLGIVYQPVKDKVSLFANYMNGFVNLAPVTQPDNSILDLDPQFGNQWEAGVKVDILQNKLTGSVSYYDISVTNSTRTEVIDNKNWTRQDGTQNSKGVEAEVITSPLPGLNIIAGYAWNENKYTKAAVNLNGKMVTFSPQHVANLWVSYFLPKGKARGLGMGIGGNYVGDSWYEATNTFHLPAYTLLNATVFYDQPTYRLAIKANNLLNKEYWNSNGTAQKPVNFLFSVGFKF